MIMSTKCMEPGLAWRLAGESCNTVPSSCRASRLGLLLPVLQAPESHSSYYTSFLSPGALA